MKKLVFMLFMLLVGCAAKQQYIEGTHLALGAYLPFEDSLYGVELLQYTNGALLHTSTNVPCQFKREYAATNSYFWGMVETREATTTDMKIEGSPTIYRISPE